MGSTGENTLVSADERLEVISKVVQWADKRVPVIAGTGSHSTEHAVRLAAEAKRAGADACLVIPPYYARPSQRGIYEHFKAVAEVGLPVMIYNNPDRAGVTVEPETIAELYKLPGIVALKDATSSLDNVVRVLALCDINVISGSDNMALPMMAVGATGVMSILSNAGGIGMARCTVDHRNSSLLRSARARAHYHQGSPARRLQSCAGGSPEKCADWCFFPRWSSHLPRSAMDGQVLLVDSLFVEPNPQPIKKVMELLGHCSDAVRLPLTECSAKTGKLLEQQLRENGLL